MTAQQTLLLNKACFLNEGRALGEKTIKIDGDGFLVREKTGTGKKIQNLEKISSQLEETALQVLKEILLKLTG